MIYKTKLVRLAQAAEILGCRQSSLKHRAWRDARGIPWVKQAGRVLFDPAALLAWVERTTERHNE